MRIAQAITANVARIVVALTFLLSGFVKAVDPLGTQYKIDDYLAAVNITSMPSLLTLGGALALSTIEFCIGILLLLATRKRLAAWGALIFVALMTVVTLWLYVANPVSDCGCFGDAIHLTNGQTLAKNVVLLILTIIIVLEQRQLPRFLSDGNSSIVFTYSVLFVIGVALYSLYLLPLFDFRPYHIGVNLRTAITGTATSEPTIWDFCIDSPAGDDITDALLRHEGYTFLLIAPYLDKADDANFGPIDQIYEYARDNGYPFYCLTASSAAAIAHWQDSTGAEYPFFFTDGTTLKTIIRSNPGMLLLHDGVIIQKWSHNNLPREEKLRARLEELSIGRAPTTTTTKKVSLLLMLYLLPIILLCLADRLWAWQQWIKSRRKASHEKDKERNAPSPTP